MLEDTPSVRGRLDFFRNQKWPERYTTGEAIKHLAADA